MHRFVTGADTGSSEDVVLIRAMRDSNVPKFLRDDLPLFHAIVGDLFPGVVVPKQETGDLERCALFVLPCSCLWCRYCV